MPNLHSLIKALLELARGKTKPAQLSAFCLVFFFSGVEQSNGYLPNFPGLLSKKQQG